jgi:hypothetical protein
MNVEGSLPSRDFFQCYDGTKAWVCLRGDVGDRRPRGPPSFPIYFLTGSRSLKGKGYSRDLALCWVFLRPFW